MDYELKVVWNDGKNEVITKVNTAQEVSLQRLKEILLEATRGLYK